MSYFLLSNEFVSQSICTSIYAFILIALCSVLSSIRMGTIMVNLKWCGCNEKAVVKQEKNDEIVHDLNGSQFDILYLMESN